MLLSPFYIQSHPFCGHVHFTFQGPERLNGYLAFGHHGDSKDDVQDTTPRPTVL